MPVYPHHPLPKSSLPKVNKWSRNEEFPAFFSLTKNYTLGILPSVFLDGRYIFLHSHHMKICKQCWYIFGALIVILGEVKEVEMQGGSNKVDKGDSCW